jgi:hypothetical protein
MNIKTRYRICLSFNLHSQVVGEKAINVGLNFEAESFLWLKEGGW